MNYIPKNINSWERLQQFIRCLHERAESNNFPTVKVLFYSPWNVASTKVRGYDSRVNLFEVPEAFHVLMQSFDFDDVKLNYVPTIATFYLVETPEGQAIAVRINDNTTAIHHELASKG